MTKYIIQSGGIKNYPEKLEKHNKEVFRDFMIGGEKEISDGEAVKVLMCFFPMPREDWEEKYEVYKENINGDVPIKIMTEMAMPDKFMEQCQWADVVFISGGDDDLARYRLDKFDISKIWKDKVVVVSSASSNYLVKAFWTCDWRVSRDGRGIIPIRFIPHYKSETYGKNDTRGPIDWDKAYKELEEYGDKNLPIYALEEGDFVTFKV